MYKSFALIWRNCIEQYRLDDLLVRLCVKILSLFFYINPDPLMMYNIKKRMLNFVFIKDVINVCGILAFPTFLNQECCGSVVQI